MVECLFGGGIRVGLEVGEIGESMGGAPGACWIFDWADGSFGGVVDERHGQVGGEAEDHVLIAAEPANQRSCVSGE